MKITASDQQLLTVLRENARASTAEIARRLKLSRDELTWYNLRRHNN